MNLKKSWFTRFITFALTAALIMTSIPGMVFADTDPAVASKRLAGDNRILTAVEISKEGWPEGSEAVVLAYSEDFPDALTGTVLAKAYDAPVLLTGSKSLTAETAQEIERLEAKTVFILGGTGVVSTEIENELSEEYDVERIGGADRFETAADIAAYLYEKEKLESDQAVVAYGRDFPDALAVSSWAAHKGVPVLLTETDNLPEATAKALEDLEIAKTVITGETGVISTKVENLLPEPTRYGGNNRYDTAIEIITGLEQNTDTMFVATGRDFPDALAGSALAAKQGKAVLLVEDVLENSVTEFLQSQEGEVNMVYVLGGDSVVSPSVLNQIVTLVTKITPEQAVNIALRAVKEYDGETADKYFNFDELIDYEQPEGSKPVNEELNKLLLSKLDWKVLSATVDGDTAVVSAEITNTDMMPVMLDFIGEIIRLQLAESQLPEEERMTEEEFDQKADEIMIDLLEREDNEMLTTAVEINLVKDGKSWKITFDADLQDAILGGLVSVMEELITAK